MSDSTGGVYAFRVNIPTNMMLGLSKDLQNTSKAKRSLLWHISRLAKALRRIYLTGEISSNQSPHIRRAFELSATSKDFDAVEALCADMISKQGDGPEALRTAANIARYSFDLAPPIYVGMTAKQTFRQRLEQHLAGHTGLYGRMREAGLSWGDCCFEPHEMAVSKGAVDIAESLTQSILQPIFSVR